MSELDRLIHALCPNGVEHLSIGSLISRERSRGKEYPDVKQVYVVSNTQGIVRAEEYRENTIHSEDTSNYTVLRQNMVAYNPSRLNIGSIARLKDGEAGLVSPMYVVFSIDSNKILYEYFDYLITSSYVSSKIDAFKEEGARFRFDFSRWDWIMIPLPPLEIQREIVRILDNFTKLIAELTAELTARKKQYEFYKQKLLSFDGDTQYGLLQDVADIYDSLHQTPKYCPEGFSMIRVQDVKSGYIDTSKALKVDKETYQVFIKKYKPQKNDIVVSRVGSYGNFAIIPDDNCCLGQNTAVIHATINPKFLYYVLTSDVIKTWIDSNVKGASQKSFSLADIKRIPIPVVELTKQGQIVDILDRFDTLCNDISAGLPAEIEARQKQYEYYRDKLLTFKELIAN